MSGRDISALLASLGDAAPDEERTLRDALSRAATEPGALPVLLEALARRAPEQRKAAAYLLRLHGKSAGVLPALCDALTDSEPKVRRNAAVSVSRVASSGGVPAEAAVPHLTAALERETVSWVRPSLILALGAIDGAMAHDALRTLDAAPLGSAEQDALRKALARSGRSTAATATATATGRQSGALRARWRPEGAGTMPLLLDVPVGFETVALEEAAERGVAGLTMSGSGSLRCPNGTNPWDVFPRMRCVHRLMIQAGGGPPVGLAHEDAAGAIAALIDRSPLLRGVREWLDTADGPIPFRLALEGGRVPRATYRRVLEAIRPTAARHGLVDSPSDYVFQLVVATGPKQTELLVVPSFVADERFVYRQRDVGASINPVVGACLARLVRARGRRAPDAEHTVFDPTCGSGTLLIERALLDPECRLRGLDVSPTAVAAARENVHAAGLGHRIRVERGDAADSRHWPACDEVIANLPFGVRTHRQDRGLDGLEHLYRALTTNLARALRPGGRAVLYTTQSRLLERVLREAHLTPTSRIRTMSGGMSVTAWCVHSRSEMALG